MKKILGLIAGLTLGAMTFAQTGIVFTDAADETYDKTATTEFHFDFGSDITLETINESATYYTDYFTVSAEAKGEGHAVTVTLVEDTEMSRRVIARFLATASSFKTPINVNGTDWQVKDFVEVHIVVPD